jgi:hypothetical protein
MAKLRIFLLINMSRPIGNIYLKKVRTLFRVIMLKLQSLSRNISANKDSLPAITMVSQDTSGHIVIRSDIRSLGSKKQEPKTGKSSSKPSKPHHASRQKRQYPHAVTMARMATPRPNTSERSLTSPRKFISMKGLST